MPNHYLWPLDISREAYGPLKYFRTFLISMNHRRVDFVLLFINDLLCATETTAHCVIRFPLVSNDAGTE